MKGPPGEPPTRREDPLSLRMLPRVGADNDAPNAREELSWWGGGTSHYKLLLVSHTHTPLLWVYFGHCNINKLTNWEGKPETDFSGTLFHWSPPNPFHDVLGISSKLMKKQHEGPAGFQTRLPLLLKELQPLQIRREASLERLRSCRAAQRFSLIKPNSGSITAPLLYPFHTL